MYMAAILGGVVGLSIAWGIDYYYRMREIREDERAQVETQAELEEIRKSYQKTR